MAITIAEFKSAFQKAPKSDPFAKFNPDAMDFDTYKDTLQSALRGLKDKDRPILLVPKYTFADGKESVLMLVGQVPVERIKGLKGILRGHACRDENGALSVTGSDPELVAKVVKKALSGVVADKVVARGALGKLARLRRVFGSKGEIEYNRRRDKVKEQAMELDERRAELARLRPESKALEGLTLGQSWVEKQLQKADKLAKTDIKNAYLALAAAKDAVREWVGQAEKALASDQDPPIKDVPRGKKEIAFEKAITQSQGIIQELRGILDNLVLRKAGGPSMASLEKTVVFCEGALYAARAAAQDEDYAKAAEILKEAVGSASKALPGARKLDQELAQSGVSTAKVDGVKSKGNVEKFAARQKLVLAGLDKLNATIQAIEKIDPKAQGLGSILESRDSTIKLITGVAEMWDSGQHDLASTSLENTEKELAQTAAQANVLLQTVRRRRPVVLKNSKVPIKGSMIPGSEDMDEDQFTEFVKKVDKKVRNGNLLLEAILEDDPSDLPPPSQQALSDLMWALKIRSESKVGEWSRGAMTIPDPGKKLRAWMDKCSEVYTRESSHMTKGQQPKEGNWARGIDMYPEDLEEKGDFPDPSLSLPYGMRTVLLQSMDMEDGTQRLYLKMETESARFNPREPGKKEKRGDLESMPESRPWVKADIKRAILHLGNLIKSKLGVKQDGEDPNQRSFREKVPAGAVTRYTALVNDYVAGLKALVEEAKKAKKANDPGADALAREARILSEQLKALQTGAWKESAQVMIANLQVLLGAKNYPSEAAAKKATDLVDFLDENFGEGLDKRIGGEVVMDLSDLR